MPSNGETRYEDFLLPPDEELTLPSGMPAVLKSPSMAYYLSRGSLPDTLTRMVREGATQEQVEAAALEDARLNPPDPKATEDDIYALIVDVFVKPKFSLTPGENEYHPSRLRIEDRTFVMKWVNDRQRGRSKELEPFRSQPDGPPVDAGGSAPVGEETGGVHS